MNRNQADIATLSVKTFGQWAAIGYSIKSGTVEVFVADDPDVEVKASRVAERVLPGNAPRVNTPGGGGRAIPFFFPGDKVPHYRCPPGTRRGGKWTDKLGSDCQLSGSRAALSRIGRRLDRISHGEKPRGDMPTLGQRREFAARQAADRLDFADPLNRVSPRRVRRNRDGFRTPSPASARRVASRLDFDDPENIARTRRNRRGGTAQRTVRRTRQTETDTSKFRTPSPRGARNLADRLDYADPENIARTAQRRARRVERSKERVRRREERSRRREERARRVAGKLDYNDPENIARTAERRARRIQRSKERTQRREARSQSREARARRTAGRLDYNDPENMAPSNRRRQGRLPAPEQTRVREPKPEAPKKPRATALETTVEDAARRPGGAKPKKPAMVKRPEDLLTDKDRKRIASEVNVADIKRDVEAYRRQEDGLDWLDYQIEQSAGRERRMRETAERALKNGNTDQARDFAGHAEHYRLAGEELRKFRKEFADREASPKKPTGKSTEPKTFGDILRKKDRALATRQGIADFESDRQTIEALTDVDNQEKIARITRLIAQQEQRSRVMDAGARRGFRDGDVETARRLAIQRERAIEHVVQLKDYREELRRGNGKTNSTGKTTQARDLVTDAEMEDIRRSAVRERNSVVRDIERRDGDLQREYADYQISRHERLLATRERQMRAALEQDNRDLARTMAMAAEGERETIRLLKLHRDTLPEPAPLPGDFTTRIEKALKPGADGKMRQKLLADLRALNSRDADREAKKVIDQVVTEMYVTSGSTNKGHKFSVEASTDVVHRTSGGYGVSVTVRMLNEEGRQVNEVGSRTLTFGEPNEVYHAHFVIAERYRGMGYGGDYIRSTIWNAREQGFYKVHTGALSHADDSYTGVRTWPRLGFEPDRGVIFNRESDRLRVEAALGKPASQITGQDIRDNFELFSGVAASSHMTLLLENLPPREEYVREKSLEDDVEIKAMEKKRTYVKKDRVAKPYTASWKEWVDILDNEWPEESEGKMPKNMLPEMGEKIEEPKPTKNTKKK